MFPTGALDSMSLGITSNTFVAFVHLYQRILKERRYKLGEMMIISPRYENLVTIFLLSFTCDQHNDSYNYHVKFPL